LSVADVDVVVVVVDVDDVSYLSQYLLENA